MNKEQPKSIVSFRIRIGVTGHRSLTDEQNLEQQIREIVETRYLEAFNAESRKNIQELQATPVSFTIISPLAEGADRLVARIVLEQTNTRLIAALPFKREDYLDDFVTPKSKDEFTTLLKKSHRCIELDMKVANATQGADTVDARRSGYRRIGEYVVEHSDILIALWDGKPARGGGGTAEIVSLAIKEGKPVFIISTKEQHDLKLENGGALNARHLDKLDAFNAWPIRDEEFQSYSLNQYDKLFGKDCGEPIPKELKQVVSDYLLPYYVRASIIAKANQETYQHTGRNAYILSTAAVFFMAVAVVFHDNRIISLLAYFCELVSLISLLVMILRAHRAHVHKNWLRCRALTEGIRTAFYLAACGMNPSHSSNLPVGLYSAESETWANKTLDEILYAIPAFKRPAGQDADAYGEYIKTCWIVDQLNYHRDKAKTNQRNNHIFKQLGLWLFGLAIAVTCAHLAISMTNIYGQLFGHWVHMAEKVISVIAVTLPAAAAAMNGYRLLMEFSRIASRSSVMADHLSTLNDQYQSVKTHEELESMLLAAKSLMLTESQDWVRLMSFAELENVV